MSLASAGSAAVKPGPSNDVRLPATQSSAVNWTNNPRSRATAAVSVSRSFQGPGISGFRWGPMGRPRFHGFPWSRRLSCLIGEAGS